MSDPRWEQLGEILVNYSTGIQPGDKVLITMMEAETLPLVRAVYSHAVQAGGLPQVEFQSAYLDRELMLFGTAAQLEQVPAWQAYGLEWADVYIGLRGARNPHEFEGIHSEKIAARKKVLGEISRLRNDRTRWVLVRVPNESFAQQAGVSLDRIMSFFFNATLKDWDVESRAYQKLQTLFQTAENVRIVGEGTDLRFSTKGRVYAVEDGHINMPGGEIYTAPVDNSAEGEIFFETPGVYAGQLIHGIRLAFSEGVVVRASAETNGALLHQLLAMDEGAKRIGEFGVGTNQGIDFISNDILYDEKIYGTVHIALGRAYSECGGINRSALHWDIIKDLRQTGEIYLENQQVFKAGRFLV